MGLLDAHWPSSEFVCMGPAMALLLLLLARTVNCGHNLIFEGCEGALKTCHEDQ